MALALNNVHSTISIALIVHLMSMAKAVKDCDPERGSLLCRMEVEKAMNVLNRQLHNSGELVEFDQMFDYWTNEIKSRVDERQLCIEKFDIASVTPEWVESVAAVFIANHASIACQSCQDIVDAAVKPYYEIISNISPELLAQFPSPNYICARMVPACDASINRDLQLNHSKPNDTWASIGKCFGCSACKSSLIMLQMYVLTNPVVIDRIQLFFKPFIARVCKLIDKLLCHSQAFPICYDQCVAAGPVIISSVIRTAQVSLNPHLFCTSVAKTCRQEDTSPNVIDCVIRSCKQALPCDLHVLCSLIPN